MFDRILVPLDGSAAAEAALPVVALIPSRRVRLLVVESEVAQLSVVCSPDGDCREYLERIAKPLRRQGRDVETIADFGDPAHRIVASAADADLVVMGSHGRGGLGRLVLGSIAEWVARHAPAPTLIVRAGQQPAATAPLTRIVVPLDGEPLAERALPMAISLADDLGIPLHLVRVVDVDPVRASVEAGTAAAAAYLHSQEKEARAAGDYLAGQVQRLRNQNLTATSELRTGRPAEELLAAIRQGDLTVLATHERGGIARWFLGSVAEDLVHRAAGPILLVRATAAAASDRRDDESAPARKATT